LTIVLFQYDAKNLAVMLLFQKRFHAGLTSGAIDLTFRRWDKPHVKTGGRYRCHPIGVLEVDRVERVRVGGITDEDARRAGFESAAELVEYMKDGAKRELSVQAEVFRIELHHGGDGDRVAAALDRELSEDDVEVLRRALARLDARSPWTRKTLSLIREHPRVAASKLAAKVKRETLPFKADVRKLKRLGLTQSFEIGYELSPRGEAFLHATAKRPPARKKRRPSPA
jgi:hypothetical protein